MLTGEPGVGKSTIVQAVRGRLATATSSLGFITEEQRDERGRRIGFRSQSVADDYPESIQLATLAALGETTGPLIGEFHVNVEDLVQFHRLALSTHSASERRPRLCYLDEIGAMQLLSPEVQALFAQTIFEGSAVCIGTIPTKGLHDLPLVEELRARADVTVLEVTAANRDGLVDEVCQLLYRALFPPHVAEAILSKAALARRYISELEARLEMCTPSHYHFRGDHGVYELRASLRQGRLPADKAALECSCPFFGESSTCSHTLALAMRREAAATKKAKFTPLVLQLDWAAAPQFAGIYQAVHAGLYEAAQLDVEVRHNPGTATDVVRAVRDHRGLAIGVSEGAVLLEALKPPTDAEDGTELVAIASMLPASPLGWMALGSRGLTSVSMFRGCTIAVHPDGVLPLRAALERHGLSLACVQLVDAPGGGLTPLFDGSVDLLQGYAFEEYVSLRRHDPSATIVLAPTTAIKVSHKYSSRSRAT